MKIKKISKTQYNEKLQELEDAQKELKIAQTEYAKAEASIIMDNCQNCKGTGLIEDVSGGDPAFNPYGSTIYNNCRKCEGKGYN